MPEFSKIEIYGQGENEQIFLWAIIIDYIYRQIPMGNFELIQKCQGNYKR